MYKIITRGHKVYCCCLIVLIILGSAKNSYSEIPDEIMLQVSNSLEKMDSTVMTEDWFYTMTTRQNEEIIISKNNPGREKAKRLELISIDGNLPSKKRLKEFNKQQKNRSSSNRRSEMKFSELVDITTLGLVKKYPEKTIVSFVPKLEELEKEREKFSGKLSLDYETGLISEITIVNTQQVKPAFSVTLNTYKTRMAFTAIDKTLLLNSMSTTIAGKVGFFKNIDVDMTINFSNFHRRSELQQSSSPIGN